MIDEVIERKKVKESRVQAGSYTSLVNVQAVSETVTYESCVMTVESGGNG